MTKGALAIRDKPVHGIVAVGGGGLLLCSGSLPSPRKSRRMFEQVENMWGPGRILGGVERVVCECWGECWFYTIATSKNTRSSAASAYAVVRTGPSCSLGLFNYDSYVTLRAIGLIWGVLRVDNCAGSGQNVSNA